MRCVENIMLAKAPAKHVRKNALCGMSWMFGYMVLNFSIMEYLPAGVGRPARVGRPAGVGDSPRWWCFMVVAERSLCKS